MEQCFALLEELSSRCQIWNLRWEARKLQQVTQLTLAHDMCGSAPSTILLVPSSLQIWRQSVQVHLHHIPHGLMFDPVHYVVDPGDHL
jgi:hypothetical protein